MSAISGIDQALWDIKGKYYDTPVYELMGGSCRDRMKVYSWVGGDRPSDVANAAKERKDSGFQAVKMNATEELQYIDSYDKIDAVLERVASIREAVGKYFGIAIDLFCAKIWKPFMRLLPAVIFLSLPVNGFFPNGILNVCLQLAVSISFSRTSPMQAALPR